MKKSVNGWTFAPEMPLAEVVKVVQQAGFQAFEPTIGEEGELTVTTDESAVRRLGERIRAAGLEVASLATGLYWKYSLTSPDKTQREQARQVTIACLDRAKWLGTDALLVVPGLVAHFEDNKLRIGYADALRLSYEALRDLAGEAEKRGVMIAIENVWNAFLVSPVETRELIDKINSPWVAAYLDVGNVLRYGVSQDWVDTLGRRIRRIHLKDYNLSVGGLKGFCQLCDGDVEWPAVMAALRQVGYDGPLTYEGPGDPADISRRIDRIMAM